MMMMFISNIYDETMSVCVYIIKSNLEKIKWEYSGEKELLGRDVYGREEKRVEL